MVGAGATGRAIALQLGTPVPGIRLVAIANRTIEHGERAFREAGTTSWRRVSSAREAEASIVHGQPVLTDDPFVLTACDAIDLLIEVTGSIEPAASVVLDAFDRYWRKPPAVKRMVWKTVPEDLTRLAMLKRGEVDIAYSLRGPLGEEAKRTPGLKLVGLVGNATQWLNFGAPQWDPKSPWHDKRVRLAAALAFDKDGINQAETLGFSRPSGSIIPSAFEFALAIPAYPYDPARAKKLLAEAGYPNGFDGGEFAVDASYSSVAEAIGNHLAAVGIRTKLRPIERAAFLGNWRDKKITSIMYTGAGGQGNAATRIQNYYVKDGLYSWGGYPDMDDLFVQQARELDSKRREALLHQIQRLAHERVMSAPLWELGFLNAVGPRVDESGLGLIALFPYSSPYEDLKLKK